MLFSLLDTNTGDTGGNWVSYVLIGVLVVILIGSMILMNRRSKKREKEAQEKIDAVKPGNKVTTIGGIVGIVVEVDPDDNTFVLETGSEDHGKCYVKFIRQAIYESDAVVEKSDGKKDGKKEEETEPAAEAAEEVPAAEGVEAVEETPAAAEQPAAEEAETITEEQTPAEESAPEAEEKGRKKSARKHK